MGRHGSFHITPGGEDPFTPDPVHLVHHAIKNAHPQIGHAQFVCIREAKGNPHVHLIQRFHHLVVLPAGIAGRFLDRG